MPSPTYQQYPMQYLPYPYAQLPMQSQQAQPQQQTLQSAGFILIPSEEDAYKYPVAPGKCMSFKVENEPIVIEKSMSYSQLETPRIDRYRLVREDIVDEPNAIDAVAIEQSHDDGLKEELQAIRRDLEGIKDKLYNNNPKPAVKKKEDERNE